MTKHPIFLKLDVALVETTIPTEERPDPCSKLFLSVRCNGHQFSTPPQAIVDTPGGRDGLVSILFQVLGSKLAEELDHLNDLTDRTPKTLPGFEIGPNDPEWTQIS